MKIETNSTGFLNDAAYRYYIEPSAKKYDLEFPELELMSVSLEEVLPDRLANGPPSVQFADENKTCYIILQFYQTRNKKNGKVIRVPGQQEVLERLDFVLKRAVREYAALRTPPPPQNDEVI
jgi:hypothetical protein